MLQATIKRVVPYIEMEEFHPDQVAKVSRACKSICQWVRAMYVYHNVALQVEPKRQALAAAQSELDETNRQLAAAQAELGAVQVRSFRALQQREPCNSSGAQLRASTGFEIVMHARSTPRRDVNGQSQVLTSFLMYWLPA